MKKKTALILGLILLLVGGVAYAELPPRISWTPGQLKPVSIAPGSSASYNFTLTHTGILPVLLTNQLRVVAEGSIAPYVTITQPKFPPVFKKGNQATLSVKVMVPTTTPLSVKDGSLVLKRFITVKVGKGTKEIVTDVWRADALPVELTFSTIPLPADPGEAGKATLAGIDADRDGVRDDLNRYIVFTYPNSERVREALKQEARGFTPLLLEANDKAKTRANYIPVLNASDCLDYVFGHNLDASDQAYAAFKIALLNTKERSHAKGQADVQMGGSNDPRGPLRASESDAHDQAACSPSVLSATN